MMASILQLFVHGCGEWVLSCGYWEGGGWQAPKISECIWQVNISLYQHQNKAKSSRLNCDN